MNWRVMRAMYTLYCEGKVKKTRTLLQDAQINFLLNSTKEITEDRRFLLKSTGFDEMYEKSHLGSYEKCRAFLNSEELLKPQTRFEEKDIKSLMEIRRLMDSDELEFLKTQISEAREDVRGVSLMFFKHDKYLEKRDGLLNAVMKIMEIDDFPANKDQQYIYWLPVAQPKCIVLCENLYFLKLPAIAKKYKVELWYAGGYNVEKIREAPKRGLPLYYSCDWDYDGLTIFQKVKKIFSDIVLLQPNGTPKNITESEHDSKWPSDSESFITNPDFQDTDRKIIRELVNRNEWVIEESNDLIDMVLHHTQV